VKSYSKEERKELITECKDWMEKGGSISSFAEEKGIAKGTVYYWLSGKKTHKSSPKTTLVHIPKVQIEPKILTSSPLLVEMRCGGLSFVFNEGYSQESIEATLLSLKKCGLL
jgi:transposase-like protein